MSQLPIYRQGDVALVGLPGKPEGVLEAPALEIKGERTGHAHVLEAPVTATTVEELEQLFASSPDGNAIDLDLEALAADAGGKLRIVSVPEGGDFMTHDDHPRLEVPHGHYLVYQSRVAETPVMTLDHVLERLPAPVTFHHPE